MSPFRVAVFIDGQNVYHGARRAFFAKEAHFTEGQFDPARVGEVIARRPRPGAVRALSVVRIYTGRPSGAKEPKAHAAHMKQAGQWGRGATVVARPLRYPFDWPRRPAEEKGIDVKLAIDFVGMALRDEYDVGVIFSADTDLVPALELVMAQCPNKVVEVAAWRSPTSSGRLRVEDANVWCHLLDQADYENVKDMRDYTK